jgi:predicted RNA-binding Zn-ribbon protein involved in translation (DUF1610 family)
MYLFLLIVLLLSALTFGVFKAKVKGVIGEKTVSSVLYFLDNSKYKVVNNVVLKIGDKTSQIDHIVISDFGMFVIETKNYKGWIVGNEKSEHWTQVIYSYKSKFYNPIRQNEGHIKTLRRCLNDYPDLEYVSIIVFSSTANIKVTSQTDVINLHHLIGTIKSYSKINLSEAEKELIFQKIVASNQEGSYNKREHIRSIKQSIQSRETALLKNQCPNCGNTLIERKGKFGKFHGCKSYPNCKFTKQIR